MTTQQKITNICLAVATATFMYFTYLYKKDVEIKLIMLSNYDNTSTADIIETPFDEESDNEILN
jgi:hypothetical protein